MAIEVERMIATLEANFNKYDRALNKALGKTNSTFGRIETRGKQMEARLAGIGSTFARSLAGGLATGFSAQQVGRLVETSQRIENSLKSTGLAGEELTNVYDQLFASAQRNAAPVESLVTLYSRLALSQKELGVSQDELTGFVDKIATALRAGGTSAQQASGALTQLSQALGGGVVRAEEFSSILEGAPTIIQAAAAGIKEAGGSVGRLRQLMIDGKVSSEAFFRGIEAGAPILDQRLAGAEQTVSQSFVRLQNVLVDAAGKFNKSTKAAETFGDQINSVAEFVNNIDFDGLITRIQEVTDAFRRGVGGARSFFTEIGRRTGLDYLGKIAAGGSGYGEAFGGAFTMTSQRGIQDRISGAFGNAVETAGDLTEEAIRRAAGNVTAGGKTGRLPAAAAGVTPITLDDYAAPTKPGGGTTKKVADTARREADKLADAIANQASVAVDAAAQFIGQHEKTNAGNINAFLTRGGVDLDAATTAWCAAFVNSALAQVGVRGSGSNIATSFANWGQSVNQADIRRGDVLVQSRGRDAGQTGGHVGFATGALRATADGIAQIEMLSGNAANKVQTQWVAASEVVARRATEGFALATESLAHLTVETEQATASQQQFGEVTQTAVSGFANALADGKIEAREVLGIVMQIAQQLLSMPGGGLGGGAGFLAGLLGAIPGFANGTGSAPGGLAWVGERGRELVNLPRGAQVVPNHRLGGGGGSQSIVINAPIHAPGADAAALARVERSIQELGKNIPKMVDARTDARQTRKVRA